MADPVSGVVSAIVYVAQASAAVAAGTATAMQWATVIAVNLAVNAPTALDTPKTPYAASWRSAETSA